MKVSAVSVMKKLASKKFKLGKAEFIGFEKLDVEEFISDLKDDEIVDYGAHIEIWAKFRISYEGEPPESYRVLNGMIQDWVDDADGKIDGEKDIDYNLKKEVNPKLIAYLKENYKDIDVSDLDSDVDDYIWEDQVDYMPEVDEEKKQIEFVVELVLEVDENDEDEE